MFRKSLFNPAVFGGMTAIILIGCDATQLGSFDNEAGPNVSPLSLADDNNYCTSIQIDISGTRLLGHADKTNSTPDILLEHPIPAGEYYIRLHTEDHAHPGQDAQLNEQWYAELFDIEGNSVLMTPPTLDLPDIEQVSYTDVGSHFIAEDIYSLRAVHAHQTDVYNSVHPTMVELYSQCNQPVNTPPVITLVGDDTITLSVNQIYIEPGATANDQTDGDLTGAISIGGDTVDTTSFGTYFVTYDVSDSDGAAAAQIIRTVVVTLGDESGESPL